MLPTWTWKTKKGGKISMKKLIAKAERNCIRCCGFPMDSYIIKFHGLKKTSSENIVKIKPTRDLRETIW